MGRALAEFHRVGAAFLDRAPAWDPLAWLTARGIDGGVYQRAERLVDALQGPPVLLHTDAHAGNFRVAAGRAVLVDLEQVAVGPALYDLAALEVTERRFRGDRASFRTFATAFGADPDDPRLPPLIALREVLAVGFVAEPRPPRRGGAAARAARRSRRALDAVLTWRTTSWSPASSSAPTPRATSRWTRAGARAAASAGTRPTRGRSCRSTRRGIERTLRRQRATRLRAAHRHRRSPR